MKKQILMTILMFSSVLMITTSCDDGNKNNKEPVQYTATDILEDEVSYNYYGVNSDEKITYRLADITASTETITRFAYYSDFHLKTKKDSYIKKISFTFITSGDWGYLQLAYFLKGITPIYQYVIPAELPKANVPYNMEIDYSSDPKFMYENREFKFSVFSREDQTTEEAKYSLYNFKIDAVSKI